MARGEGPGDRESTSGEGKASKGHRTCGEGQVGARRKSCCGMAGNQVNPMVAGGVQQTRTASYGVNRRSREERQGRTTLGRWHFQASGNRVVGHARSTTEGRSLRKPHERSLEAAVTSVIDVKKGRARPGSLFRWSEGIYASVAAGACHRAKAGRQRCRQGKANDPQPTYPVIGNICLCRP
jgi:hypothetical protein